MIRTAMGRPVTVCMFVVAVALFGLISLSRLSLNLLPEVSYPTLTIQTDFPDAAPEEVESLVTRPIEEAVGVVGGLTRLSSISRSGQSEVILEYGWKTNMDLATLDAREKLDLLTLPRDVERPIILRFDPSQDPVLRLQLYGEMPLSRLRYVADKELKRSLESTKGVAAIKVQGGIEEQIHIEIDEKRLAEMGIPITRVTQILADENLNQASGSLYDLDSSYLVRILNQFRSVEEIKDIVIRSQDGRRIVLGDVATIWRGEKERDVITRYNGRESVELAIFKEGDANTVTVVRAVLARLESLQNGQQFPKGVDYAVVFNQAEFIENAVNDVLWAAALGGILAIAVLFLFLRHLRSTFSIGLSIPISIMATFALMYQTGLSLNIMSLGGIALGVGMLVDSSIVVLEAVHRHRREDVSLFDSVHRGAREVGPAVLASTLTTIAVFLPLIFVEGIAGQLFKDQALTITYSLAASLLVALTFLPMLLALRVKDPQKTGVPDSPSSAVEEREIESSRFSRAFRWTTGKTGAFFRFLFTDVIGVVVSDLVRFVRFLGRGIRKVFDPFLNRWDHLYSRLSRSYPSVLRKALDHKVAVFALTFLLAVSASLLSRKLGTELIPPLAQGEFSFELRLPHGTPLQRTQDLVARLEERVSSYPEVEAVFSNSGQTGTGLFVRQSNQQNMARLFVVMKDRQDKQLEYEVIERIRGAMEEHPELTYTFARPALFSFKTPVEVEIYGYSLETLSRTADQVAERLRRLPGLSDIKTTTEEGYPELLIQFDRERLARFGLEEGRVAQILRNKIRGDVASRYREEDRQIEILVRAHESDRNTVESIRNLVINAESITGTPSTSNTRQQNFPNDQRSTNSASSSTPDEVLLRTADSSTTALDQRAARPSIPIRLGSVARIEESRGPAEIRRIHSQRAAIVSANLSGRDLGTVSEEITRELEDLRLEAGSAITIGLGGQNDELQASYTSLGFALALAVILVYLVMASQFESLVHPFIIMFTVPLGAIGVIFALYVTGTTISVMVLLGTIILVGIVVNNAILLVDYTNQLRQSGLMRREALIQAGVVRLRPILMTTLTTVLGLTPMALGWGDGAEVRTPMAIAVMGGLTFCTVLTLIFVPVVYEVIDRKQYAADLEVPVPPKPAPGLRLSEAERSGS